MTRHSRAANMKALLRDGTGQSRSIVYVETGTTAVVSGEGIHKTHELPDQASGLSEQLLPDHRLLLAAP